MPGDMLEEVGGGQGLCMGVRARLLHGQDQGEAMPGETSSSNQRHHPHPLKVHSGWWRPGSRVQQTHMLVCVQVPGQCPVKSHLPQSCLWSLMRWRFFVLFCLSPRTTNITHRFLDHRADTNLFCGLGHAPCNKCAPYSPHSTQGHSIHGGGGSVCIPFATFLLRKKKLS